MNDAVLVEVGVPHLGASYTLSSIEHSDYGFGGCSSSGRAVRAFLSSPGDGDSEA
jgi:hypothetical protein